MQAKSADIELFYMDQRLESCVVYIEPRSICIKKAEVSKRQYSLKANSSNIRDFAAAKYTVDPRVIPIFAHRSKAPKAGYCILGYKNITENRTLSFR
jgi:hypothetical protein